jgi:hypothetical protein
MKTRYAVALSVVAGAALGAAAAQGLHAQAKPKAYTVSESETVDTAHVAAFVSKLEDAQSAAGGQLSTLGADGLFTWTGRQLHSEWQLSSGTVWSRHKHFTNRRPITILPRTATERSG